MYCANCGVKLADTEKTCPLCGVTAYHPDIPRPEAEPLYAPHDGHTIYHVTSKASHIIITTGFILPMLVSLLCDLKLNHGINWAGYVVGSLVLAYLLFILPTWFRRPNPVVFASIDVAATILLLLYVNLSTGGHWFLSLAFPAAGVLGALLIGTLALFRYLKKGRLYVIGGGFILLGLFMILLEFLIYITFHVIDLWVWSFYPALILVLLGAMFIFLAINDRVREAMEKKFFI